ncbi:MAG: cytochrome d ubiquinol oxidase subunit II [Cyclobacteriaceae bacterium]|nr:cytochrome d ubiquinol oxidase subunit II [Cyclobacteriaceae bacterium HetDA_MAG_MS6]
MEITWLCILVFMFIMYAMLDGFDFGAGILDLFIARNDQESMLIKRSIGPFWDGNEVWLVAGGGVMFMAFPKLYASFFSGFYLPLMLVLWLIIARAIGLELRNMLDNQMWRIIWDRLFGVASLLLALVFGIALGNVIRGVNLGGVENGESLFEPHYFFSPFWTTMAPSANPGVIDWFSLSVGIVAVLTVMIHGGNWVVLKTKGELTSRIKLLNKRLSIIVFVLAVMSFFAMPTVQPTIVRRFSSNMLLMILPALSLATLILNVLFQNRGRELGAFICSSLFIAGMFVSAVVGIFPTVLPSTNLVHPDLTVFSTANTSYGLQVALKWWLLGIVLITGYTIMIHWVYRGKIADENVTYSQYH